MKLMSILKTLDYPQLESIREFWEIQAPPFTDKSPTAAARQKKLLEHLYFRLQQEQYFRHIFDKLSRDEKNLIYFLTIHGGDLEETEVAQRCFHGDFKALKNHVNALTSKGFVFFEDLTNEEVGAVMVGIPEPYLRCIELPAYWEGYLGNFLKDRSAAQLRAMAVEGLKLKPVSNKKNYLLVLIRKFLLNPANLKMYLNSLPSPERAIFETLKYRNGVCIYRDLLATGYQKRYDHSKADFVNNLLSTSGLIFTVVPDQNKYNNLLMIPRDIDYIVSHDYQPDNRNLSELDTVSLVGDQSAPPHILDNSNYLLRDLVIFASYIFRNQVKTLANGGIGKNDLKKILPFLSANKTIKYVGFLALFCISKKFILGVSGLWKVTANFTKWLEDSQQCYRDLYQFWLETNEWNEEYSDGDTVHTEFFPSNLVNIAEMRKLVIKNIANIPHRRWMHFSSFVNGIIPQIDINIPNRGSQMIIEKNNRPNSYVVESILAETMYWMGLLSLGLKDLQDAERLGNRTLEIQQIGPRRVRRKQQRGGEIEFYFKLTDLGKHIFETEDPLNPASLFTKKQKEPFEPLKYEIKYFIVQPNLDVITPPDLNLYTFYRLNEFADIKKIDVMSTLTIARDSLRDGMDKGLNGEQVLQFLEESCRPSLPETVKHLINECSQKHGEVYMGYAGGYIYVNDPILLEDLRSHRKVQSTIKDVVDQKVVILNPNVNVKLLAKDLKSLGFMPKLDSDRVHQTSDNKFHLTLNKEDLYYLIASLKFIIAMEEQLGSSVSEDKVAPLVEHLKPDPETYVRINFYVESLTSNFVKHFQNALKKKIAAVTSKYKKQLSSLIATAVPRTPTKYSFSGPNPAVTSQDIRAMVEFAIEHDFQIEIDYLTTSTKMISELVAPESLEEDKIYGFCEKHESYKVFSLKRVKKSKLI